MKNDNYRMLTYAKGKDNRLVNIDEVPNGKDCGCICPCCNEPLWAYNGNDPDSPGRHPRHHFKHEKSNCSLYYETTLHLLAKEIIRENKTVMLPRYKELEEKRVQFRDVEVEERNDVITLQPDCVGITDEGNRVHIEIFVTHRVDERKRCKIIENSINCVEIEIPYDFPLDKEKIKDYIENNANNRVWINYPIGDVESSQIEIRRKEYKKKYMINRIRWFKEHDPDKLISIEDCNNCELNYGMKEFCKYYEGCKYYEELLVCGDEKFIVCDYKKFLIACWGSREKIVISENWKNRYGKKVCPQCGGNIFKAGQFGLTWYCSSCGWRWD